MHVDRQATEKKRPQVEKILLPPAARLKNEKRPFRSEQKTGNKPNNHLTEKLPYKSANHRSLSCSVDSGRDAHYWAPPHRTGDPLAVGEKFAAMRFDLEPAELDASSNEV